MRRKHVIETEEHDKLSDQALGEAWQVQMAAASS